MSDKLPQPTDVLVQRLCRMAKALDTEAFVADLAGEGAQVTRSRANLCLQAAARLQDFLDKYGRDISE